MGLHDHPFFGAQLARLEQDMVGYADLADVMQRRGFGQQLDIPLGQELVETGTGFQITAVRLNRE
jgi:hypothetical protein